MLAAGSVNGIPADGATSRARKLVAPLSRPAPVMVPTVHSPTGLVQFGVVNTLLIVPCTGTQESSARTLRVTSAATVRITVNNTNNRVCGVRNVFLMEIRFTMVSLFRAIYRLPNRAASGLPDSAGAELPEKYSLFHFPIGWFVPRTGPQRASHFFVRNCSSERRGSTHCPLDHC